MNTQQASDAEWLDRLVALGVEQAVVTLGPEGVLHADESGITRVPAIRSGPVLDVTGAGDALAAGYLAAVVLDEPDPIGWGLAAASLAVETVETVPASVTLEMLRERL